MIRRQSLLLDVTWVCVDDGDDYDYDDDDDDDTNNNNNNNKIMEFLKNRNSALDTLSVPKGAAARGQATQYCPYTPFVLKGCNFLS